MTSFINHPAASSARQTRKMADINFATPIRFQNVLLATDFSEASVAAVGHAAAVARTYQGIVDVVHVIVPEVYWWAPPESLRSIEDGIQLWAEREMKDVLASERLHDVPHQGIIKHGEIWAFCSLLSHNATAT